MKKIGYARVSTKDQKLGPQIEALQKEGCEKIYSEKISGARTERKQLQLCLDSLQAGDVLVVWKLDRLGRSLPHLVEIVGALKDREISFKSITDGLIDTSTASGELIFHIFAALSQFERNLIRERTRAGLESARARGKVGGRKPLGADHIKVRMAKVLHQRKDMSINEMCRDLEISRTTFYRYLKKGES